MASFIEGYCNQQFPPPYIFRGVRIWSFPLLASFEKVQGLVRKYLLPAAESLGDLSFDLIQGPTVVYMMVLDYGKMACASPLGHSMGSFAQKELLFGIPVVQTSRNHPPRTLFFCPYIFVDNGGSMIAGNTVLGYPKQPAWFQVPPPGGEDYPIRIDAPVLVRFGADTPQTWQRFVQVRAVSSLAERMTRIFNGVTEDFSRNLLLQVGADGMSFDILQLKQFRNAQFPGQACYRSLVTCTSVLRKLHSVGRLPEAEIDLASFASLDLIDSLGLAVTGGVVFPLFPYKMECDFDFINPIERAF